MSILDPVPACPYKKESPVMTPLGRGYIDSQSPDGKEYLIRFRQADFTQEAWTHISNSKSRFVFRFVPSDQVKPPEGGSQDMPQSTEIRVGQFYRSNKSPAEYQIIDIDTSRVKIKSLGGSGAWWTTQKSIESRFTLIR